MRRIAVLDAPSNLGLRPPTPTSVPGCAKAPGALRDHGLVTRLAARDAGCVTPPRYDPGDWRPGDGVAQADEIGIYTRRLAERIEAILEHGEFPVVLGGDCSIVLGAALAMRRRAATGGGRAGLVYVDGHSDFRHPANASYVGAAAGEGLALATGRGQADLAAIEALRPYFRDRDVVVLGVRTHDDYRLDLQAAGIAVRAVPQLRAEGAARSAQWARRLLADCTGYWVHVDVDVLDPAVMPAVDAPDPGGIAYAELELLLANLVGTPRCLGVEVTVFDPDYDPTGGYAREVVHALVGGLSPAAGVPPLDRPGPATGATAVPAATGAAPAQAGPAGGDSRVTVELAAAEEEADDPARSTAEVLAVDQAVDPAVDLAVDLAVDPADEPAEDLDGFDASLPHDPWADDDPAFVDGYRDDRLERRAVDPAGPAAEAGVPAVDGSSPAAEQARPAAGAPRPVDPLVAPRPRVRDNLAGLADQVRAAVSGLGVEPDPDGASAPGRLRRRPTGDPTTA